MAVEHGFAAGEEERGNSVAGEFINEADAFSKIQLARIMFRGGVRVTVNTSKIAASGEVPNDHGFAQMGGLRGIGPATVAKGIGRLFSAAEE